MNIESALEEVGYLLEMIDDPYEPEVGGKSRVVEVGSLMLNIVPHLRYLHRFAESVSPVPTGHDQQAEMDKWDDLFTEMGEKKNG